MPHPERACELAVGSTDGLVILESAVAWLARSGTVGRESVTAVGA
jgi:hypothetical protein